MKTMSPIQIEANRNNALRSTGPKTPAGKAASSVNATKYGILARQLIIQGQNFQESAEEFQNFWTENHQHLAPVGPLEEMLVDQIVAINWRMRRVRAAESAEIALSVDAGCRHRSRKPDPDAETEEWPHPDRYMQKDLLELREKIEQGGDLTMEAVDKIADDADGDYQSIVKGLDSLHAQISENPDGLDPAALRERNRQTILNTLDEELKKLSEQMSARVRNKQLEEQSQRNSDFIPRADIMEKILRYDTTLERQLFRAMEQLERLQTRRLGNNISPPPVTSAPAPV